MGLLTDFFIAARSSLDPQKIEEGPDGTYPTESWKNVDTIQVAILENLLTGVDYDTAMAGIEKSSPSDPEGEGPWVYGLSENLVKALGALDPTRTHEIAASWMATEDGQGLADDIDSYVEMLESFSSLARKAIAGNLGMYLWVCL